MPSGAVFSLRSVGSLAIAVLIGGLWTAQAYAEFIYDQVLTKDPNRTKSDERRYALYVPSCYKLPSGCDGQKTVPLVVAVHGCNQTERTVADKSALDEVAEKEGFIVAYPYIGDNAGHTNDEGGRNPRCWGFWFADEIHRDNGEVGDLARLVDEVKTKYTIDPKRIHIMGISSGGAITTAALVAYPDKFASGAVLDGVGYAETASVFTGGIPSCDTVLDNDLGAVRPQADVIRDMRAEMRKSVLRQVPVMVVHNKKDCTVPFKVGQAIAKAFAGLMAEEGKAVDITTPVFSTSGTTGKIPWTHNAYGRGPNGESLIEEVYLDAYYKDLQQIETRLNDNPYVPGSPAPGSPPNDIDRGHAWFGADQRGPWFLTVGPVTAEVAWAFFKDHPQSADNKPVVTCAEPSVSARSVTLKCSGSGPNPIKAYHVIISGPSPKDDTLPDGHGFSKQYDNLISGNYEARVNATDDQGEQLGIDAKGFTIPPPSPTCVAASNSTHVAEGRAHACYFWFYCANGSDNYLGFFASTITSLQMTKEAYWAKVTQCP